MRRVHSFGWTLALGLLFSQRAYAETLAFSVDQDSPSKIEFVSDATLERITGVCSALAGEVTFDPEALERSKARVTLDVAALHTGLDLRDEHLHGENWLDAKHFPQAIVVIERVSGAKTLLPGRAANVTIQGKLTLHGVTRPFQAKAKVRWTKAKEGSTQHALHVVTSFQVPLEAHGVSIPSVVTLKVAREIQVNVDLYAHTH